jgi:hypothetical protein
MFLYPCMQHTQMPCPDSLLTFSPIPTPVYSGVTVTLLAQHNHLPSTLAMYYCTVCALALASHSKTMFTDPGAVPPSAVPLQTSQCQTHSMCSHCQSFKPPVSHHCRICNRCISRMDHHCPWMNNCVGAGNLSEFVACVGVFCIAVLQTTNVVSGRQRLSSHSLVVSMNRTLYLISSLYVAGGCVGLDYLCLELLSLQLRCMYLFGSIGSIGPRHDCHLHRCRLVHIEHAHEYPVRRHDGNRNHRSIEKESRKYVVHE